MLKKLKKSKIIEEFQVHNTDTGSPEVQAAILTEQIKKLASHLKKHTKDNHSRFGLLKMVAKRKKLVDYLAAEDQERQKKLLKKLELKK